MSTSAFREILNLYDFGFSSKIRTYQRWYCGTPYEYVETFVPKQGAVVDLGCGWGMFANLLAIKSPERTVCGVDLDKSKINWAQKTVKSGNTNISFECKDLNHINLPQVDAITVYDVLHHLDASTQISVLKECHTKLKPGGTLILKENDVVPLWKLMVSHLVEAIALGFNITLSKKILFRSRTEWVKLLKEAGFAVTHEEHIQTPYGFFVPHSLFICEKSG